MGRKRVNLITPSVSLLFLAGGCFNPYGSASDQQTEVAKCLSPDEELRLSDQVLQLVNLERAEANLAPVVVNPNLQKVAADYACRMVEEGFFGHKDAISGAGPGARAIAEYYPFYAVGENLAAGQETPAEVMRLWMDSPTHRAIILNERWKDVGIAVRTGGEYGIYWVQEFGDPVDF